MSINTHKNNYQGDCHCGNIRYQFWLPKTLEFTSILACNCSMCEKTAYLHLIVPKNQFKLLTDKNDLSNYQFNKKIAQHYFCKTCGIKSFYQPRSHPNSWSINARCIENFSDYKLIIENFDGKNWENNIEEIT